ncbi:uncharacterized protein [Haliotis cracherodii]|uniref:uncharacterized protein n=1 Tax=Haliotis cracherodii TaxID=6455 RepID=UPI0039EB2349
MLRLELVQTLSQKRKKSLFNMPSTLEKKIQNNEFVCVSVTEARDCFDITGPANDHTLPDRTAHDQDVLQPQQLSPLTTDVKPDVIDQEVMEFHEEYMKKSIMTTFAKWLQKNRGARSSPSLIWSLLPNKWN